MRSQLRCLAVDGQLMFQQLLISMLARRPGLEMVGGASTAAEGIAACVSERPDLLILDVCLPDADGLSVARALQVLNPEARVIVLSSSASTLERPTDLRDRIIASLDKGSALQDLIAVFDTLLQAVPVDSAAKVLDCSVLTSREQEIVVLLGQGLATFAIAEQLGISRRTVQTHRHNIAQKTGFRGASLVHQATLVAQALGQ